MFPPFEKGAWGNSDDPQKNPPQPTFFKWEIMFFVFLGAGLTIHNHLRDHQP
jgi:hypothetical protein